ncbi:CDPK-related protein kinase-like [Mangifera indica]|uniref:CDPK-related protein kinase-like n=1 Tax=Mangifera indica TaxID=29780 RepID=UPI001CF9F31E|nr:CDPK-related protein kinase-like [Mangifera indica]XP_044507174.1 CDPK-related protein kinase-like [Mangifera indica]
MKDSRIPDFLASLNALQYRKMEFEEFCAAALNVNQLEALENWEQHAHCAYELFEKDGNRAIVINELASELGLGPIPLHTVLNDWIRHTDGKLAKLSWICQTVAQVVQPNPGEDTVKIKICDTCESNFLKLRCQKKCT